MLLWFSVWLLSVIVSAAMLLLRCSMQLLCSCLCITDSCYSAISVIRMFLGGC